MEITKDRALRRLRDLIEYYNISRCEGIPGDIPVVEVPLDRADILALQLAIESLDTYDLIVRLSDIDAEPVTTSGKIRKDCMKMIRKRTRGKWIPQDEFGAYFKCSICGMLIDNDFPIYRNFCPNCGADMQKEGESHEN